MLPIDFLKWSFSEILLKLKKMGFPLKVLFLNILRRSQSDVYGSKNILKRLKNIGLYSALSVYRGKIRAPFFFDLLNFFKKGVL